MRFSNMINQFVIVLCTAVALLGVAPVAQARSLDSRATHQISDFEVLNEKLDDASQYDEIEKQASILFPDDASSRLQYISVASSVDEIKGQETQALPAALAPFVAVLGKCVVGALGGSWG